MPTITSLNPSNDEVLQEFQSHSEGDWSKIVERTADVQLDWRKTSMEHRTELLRNLAAQLRRNVESYGRLIATEMGKPIAQAIGEVDNIEEPAARTGANPVFSSATKMSGAVRSRP